VALFQSARDCILGLEILFFAEGPGTVRGGCARRYLETNFKEAVVERVALFYKEGRGGIIVRMNIRKKEIAHKERSRTLKSCPRRGKAFLSSKGRGSKKSLLPTRRGRLSQGRTRVRRYLRQNLSNQYLRKGSENSRSKDNHNSERCGVRVFPLESSRQKRGKRDPDPQMNPSVREKDLPTKVSRRAACQGGEAKEAAVKKET